MIFLYLVFRNFGVSSTKDSFSRSIFQPNDFYRVFTEGELFIAHLVPSVSALYAKLSLFFLLWLPFLF
jgi:hypothetical protein